MNINPTQAIRNIWLIELFEENADGLTLQDIIDEYNYRPPQLGNNVSQNQVSERTIYNWFKEVDEVFQVKILCGRGKKIYHIENDDYSKNPLIDIARQIKKAYDQYVFYSSSQHKKSGKTRYGELYLGFMQVGNSMLNGESITIRYGKKHDEISFDELCVFMPFSQKVIENECYVIGMVKPVSGLWNERIEVYSLDRLQVVQDENVSAERYAIPYDFRLIHYCEDFHLGHLHRNEDKPMVVFLNADNETADYLREHPIAPTLTEIESNRTKNKNVFMVVIKPNEDFFTQILSFGEELTITNPDFLKREGDENSKSKKTFGFQRYEEDLIGYDYRSLNHLNVLKRKGVGVQQILQAKHRGLGDEELVSRLLQGENDCFDTLYNKYKTGIITYLKNLTKENYYADHLASITWEKVYFALLKGQYKESEQFENWLKVIAKRTFLNWCKDQKRDIPSTSLNEDWRHLREDEGPERALEKAENTRVLKRLISDLPPQLKRVLELDQKGFTTKEIAEQEGVPEQTIKQRYKAAVRAIQDMLF